MTFPVPRPRHPLEAAGRAVPAGPSCAPGATRGTEAERLRSWYVDELGWGDVFTAAGDGARTEDGHPRAHLLTGLRFDVLELPEEAGIALLGRLGRGGRWCPVARHGGVLRFLVAAGAAEELPAVLDWLDWGPVVPELGAAGRGGRIAAPLPPGVTGSQGAAVWVRPPELGTSAQVLPGPPAIGSSGGTALSLVRLADAAASCCLGARLRRAAAAQPLAFS